MKRRTAVIATAALLAGCGFQLRRPRALPFRSIALVGFTDDSPLRAEMAQALREAGVSLLADPALAEVVFEALQDRREKTVAASTAAAQVREVQLRVRLRFRVATPAARLLLPAADLLLTRDMSYSETDALAKLQEEALLYRAMDDDIVAQVLQRLASLRLDRAG